MVQIPGSNLLRKAFTVIARQELQYYRAIGRNQNNVGQYVTQYDAVVTIRGSFQPVPRAKYQYMGLDFQKSYYNLYIPKNLVDLNRDVSADQVAFQGQLYQCQSDTEWYGVDGWTAIICVLIGVNTHAAPIIGMNTVPTENDNTNFSGGNFLASPYGQDAPFQRTSLDD